MQRRRQDASDEDQRRWAHHRHHAPHHWSQLQGYDNNGTSYYDDNGTEPQTIGNDTFGVGHNNDCIYYPYISPYVMVSDGSEEEEQQHHHNMYPQMMIHRPPPPQTPVPPSLPHLMMPASPQPQSYFMRHSPAVMMQPQPTLPPQPTLLPQPPSQPPPKLTTITVDNNMIHQHQQCSNPCSYNEGNNGLEMVTNDSSLACIRQRHLKEKTVISGMTSTVVVNNNLSQRTQPSTKNETIEESTSPAMTTVTDDTVVSVCKRTILSAIQKIIIEDYRSAMYKLCKIIRILDILMFNEGGTGIGSAKIETVRPWLETLKDMKRRISLKQQHQYNGEKYNDAESSTIPKAEDSHRNRSHIGSTSYRFPRNHSSSSSSSSNEDSGRHVSCHSRKSYTRRYRTTGKLIAVQNRRHRKDPIHHTYNDLLINLYDRLINRL